MTAIGLLHILISLVIMESQSQQHINDDQNTISESQHEGEKMANDDEFAIKSSLGNEEVDGEDDEEDELNFPRTIDGFGYHFNDEGRLVTITSNEPFNFNIRKNNPDYNQLHYESLGEAITLYVYRILQTETQLIKVPVPVDASNEEPQSFIFMSDDALTNKNKLLVLLHGSGVVRAGQWARRLIINDCLDSGTQIPFIKRAKDEDFGVIVLNTNDNYRTIDSKRVPIRGCERPEHHMRYVWDHFIKDAKAKHVAFVAHSYGGAVFLDLALHRFEQIKSRVVAVAFTDSVHSLTLQRASVNVINWIHNVACNWVTSKEPLDTPVIGRRSADDVPCLSAGHLKHEMTSWSSFTSIFSFLNDKINKTLAGSSASSSHGEL